jgi:hypothetical protein
MDTGHVSETLDFCCDSTHLLTWGVCHWIWVYLCNQKTMWIIFILCHYNAVSYLYLHEFALYRYNMVPNFEYSFGRTGNHYFVIFLCINHICLMSFSIRLLFVQNIEHIICYAQLICEELLYVTYCHNAHNCVVQGSQTYHRNGIVSQHYLHSLDMIATVVECLKNGK